MKLYLHEWKMLQKSTWIWIFTLCIVMVFFFFLFPTFTREVEFTQRFMQAFPIIIQKIIGYSFETFFSAMGFYSFIFAYIVLLGSIQAMNLGLALLCKETRDKTVDFLLTKPITRTHILTEKILAGLTAIVATNMVYYLLSILMIKLISHNVFDVKALLLINLSLFFVQSIFFSLGLLLSVILPKIKSVISVTLTTVFAFFILDLFNSVVKDEILRFIIPYKYFNVVYILNYGRYENLYLCITVVFVITAVATTYQLYRKKDFLI